MPKGKTIPYSDTELVFVRRNCALPITELHAKFSARFDRPDVSAANLHSLRKRKKWRTGRTGQFVKGQESWNKGLAGTGRITSNRGSFKPGREPHNTRYAGHERTDADGYVMVSVEKTNPHTGYRRHYVHKHRHLWEKKHGPIPAGHILKSLNGNKSDWRPENWMCVPRGVLPILRWMRFDDLGTNVELRRAALATALLKYHASKAAKNA